MDISIKQGNSWNRPQLHRLELSTEELRRLFPEADLEVIRRAALGLSSDQEEQPPLTNF